MLFISYYTKNTPYEEVINKQLLPSLKKWELKYYIEGVDDLGSWANNTDFKATFILRMLEKYKQDVVWIDADATIEKYPSLLFEIPPEYDIAVHYLDWQKHWHQKKDKFELVSATVLFRYNEKTLRIIKEWIKNNKTKPSHKWEQKILQEVIEKDKEIKVYRLPVEYCCVVLSRDKIATYIKDPVIIQHQASRKYKHYRRKK